MAVINEVALQDSGGTKRASNRSDDHAFPGVQVSELVKHFRESRLAKASLPHNPSRVKERTDGESSPRFHMPWVENDSQNVFSAAKTASEAPSGAQDVTTKLINTRGRWKSPDCSVKDRGKDFRGDAPKLPRSCGGCVGD